MERATQILKIKQTWNTTKMQRIMQVSPLTMALSIMSQMLLKWRVSIGCCLPSRAPRGKLLQLAASKLSWWIHIAPMWWSSWLITSAVATISSIKSTFYLWSYFSLCTRNIFGFRAGWCLPLGSLITWLTPSLWHTWWKAWFPGLHHWSM